MTMLYSSDGFDYEGFEYSDEIHEFVDKDDPECILDLELEYDTFCMNFDRLFREAPGFVCTGNSYSRYGLSWQEGPGGNVLTDISGAGDFLNRFLPRGAADIRVDDDNGELTVTVSHHDGSMTMHVRELTDRGLSYYNNHEYDLSRREMCEKLFSTRGLSKEVNAANRVWGTPKKKSKGLASACRKRKKAKQDSWIVKRSSEKSSVRCPSCGSTDCEKETSFVRHRGQYPDARKSVHMHCRKCDFHWSSEATMKESATVRLLGKRKR